MLHAKALIKGNNVYAADTSSACSEYEIRRAGHLFFRINRLHGG